MDPLDQFNSRRIGSIEYVSPYEIRIALDYEAPEGTIANEGVLPRPFPRINSYVLLTIETGYIVAQIEWISVEQSPYPKRKGFQDFGLVDLPFPLRKMRANPLGVLQRVGKSEINEMQFKRGVQTFPNVGEPVLIPTDKQLQAIIESGENRRIKIGESPLAANAEVKIDPDRLFGRHLAILGNTGSGKSCSVAGIIKWCLDAAEKKCDKKTPNARFIILDPNGEYSRVFYGKQKHKAKIFKVEENENTLKVPNWLWNSAEWCSIMQASSRVQAPLLRRALRSMRNEVFEVNTDISIEIKKFLEIILQSINVSKSNGEPYRGFPQTKNFTERLVKWKESLEQYIQMMEASELISCLKEIIKLFETTIDKYKIKKTPEFTDYPVYNMEDINKLIETIKSAFQAFGGSEKDLLPKHEDVPIKFSSETFINYLEVLAQETNNEQFLDFLITRIRTMLSDARMENIIGDNADITLDNWLSQYIGTEDDAEVTVIDLSLVPAEIIHIVTAVISRLVFEALQRYRKLSKNKETLPTVIVAEEAHTFIKRYNENSEYYNSSAICTQVFEKIAREGRKYGLGLLLSSQRPSELSPTVLSQCNSFLLHRISNDKDQELVNLLVPDNLRGLLKELPSLPSQYAILLGWAAELPVMVRINDLSENEQPYSKDPDFWDVWTRTVERKVDWKEISNDWQMKDD